jgi:hypothetical protein
MPSWLAVFFIFEAGFLNSGFVGNEGATLVNYENMSYISFEARAEAGPLFVSGGTRSIQKQLHFNAYVPVMQRYDIGAGLKLGNFELGWSHWCEHPVMSQTTRNNGSVLPVDSSMDAFYFRAEFEIGGNR